VKEKESKIKEEIKSKLDGKHLQKGQNNVTEGEACSLIISVIYKIHLYSTTIKIATTFNGYEIRLVI
jgi:hypothetical protein